MKLMHDYQIDTNNTDKILEVEILIEKIRATSEVPLNYYVLPKGTGFKVPRKVKIDFEPFYSSFVNILSYLDDDTFFKDYCEIEGEEKFWGTFKNFYTTIQKNRDSIKFLSAMDRNAFEQLISHLFSKYILFDSTYDAECGFSIDDTSFAIDTLKKFNTIIIGQRSSESSFLGFAVERFGFTEQYAQIIWDLFVLNKKDLQIAYLLDGISTLKDWLDEFEYDADENDDENDSED